MGVCKHSAYRFAFHNYRFNSRTEGKYTWQIVFDNLDLVALSSRVLVHHFDFPLSDEMFVGYIAGRSEIYTGPASYRLSLFTANQGRERRYRTAHSTKTYMWHEDGP